MMVVVSLEAADDAEVDADESGVTGASHVRCGQSFRLCFAGGQVSRQRPQLTRACLGLGVPYCNDSILLPTVLCAVWVWVCPAPTVLWR